MMNTHLMGKKIGKYIIKEALGRGGMGRIYKAYHPTLERDVAIKLIQLDQVNDPQIVDRFRREARVVAALRHPGIVQIYDFDIEGDIFYMVMEFVPGESLAQRLAGIHAQAGQMPLDEALRLFRLIMEAVAHAHQRGVIHCDLKPGNVLLTTDGQPILSDFGISKLMSGERLTKTDDIMGTPHYMAPEQGFGRNIDTHTDVYALGVMLYELTTGTLPFSGDTSLSIVYKHVNEYPKPPRAFNPDMPEALEQIIEKAMAKDPADRYASAQEMLDILNLYLPVQSPAAISANQEARVFICHIPTTEPDQALADYLFEALAEQGHVVCLDQSSQTGETPLEQIGQEIQSCDFFIVLLSKTAADSEMLKSEISQAYEYYKKHGKPHILPVRVDYDGLLPYTMPSFIDSLHYIDWQDETDNNRVVEVILDLIAGQLSPTTGRAQLRTAFETGVVSEDGRLVADDETSPPLPAFDPRVLQELLVPGGAVKLRDKLYLERDADAHLKEQIIRWGTTTTIRAPRQTGKTSLLMRGINYAREQGTHVVFLDFQSFGSEQLASLDLFLQELAASICDELELDEEAVEQAWTGSRSSTKKLIRFMEKHVLPSFDEPIVLAMDEADSLLQTDFYKDFFGLLRSWHNRRASRPVWEKLNMVLVVSTEPYLLIDDIHQSPFNVGLHLGLTDFDEAQLRDLNFRHGSPVAEQELPQLVDLLNGHPYLTRLALYKMVAESISWADLSQQAPHDYGPFGDHLRHQYWIIHDKPALKNALKDIIRTKCCPDEVSLFRLLRAGLIKGSGDLYTCRCGLYRLYFEDKLL